MEGWNKDPLDEVHEEVMAGMMAVRLRADLPLVRPAARPKARIRAEDIAFGPPKGVAGFADWVTEVFGGRF